VSFIPLEPVNFTYINGPGEGGSAGIGGYGIWAWAMLHANGISDKQSNQRRNDRCMIASS
jgi:hypothetical protein